MKKLFAIVLATALALCLLVSCGAPGDAVPKLEVLTQFGDLSADDAEYAPSADYDKYTLFQYYIEAADATVLATCSAKADDSEYLMEFSFYGDDQLVVLDKSGTVKEDKTGFMATDAPLMLEYVQKDAVWSAIPNK